MLRATTGRIIISIDKNLKNFHTLSNGVVLNISRRVGEVDRKYTEPTNATVINAENIPKGAEVLLHHNAIHNVFCLGENAEGLPIYSITKNHCYAWRTENSDWQPTDGYEFGLRVFKPDTSNYDGILPTKQKNRLYVTTGEYKGQVIITMAASDYEITFMDRIGQTNKLIRFRHSKKTTLIRDEFICVDNELTEKVNSGEYLIGFDAKNCKKKSND
jgi:hypothetical protein